SWISGHKSKLTILDAGVTPREIFGSRHRFPVLIGPEERKVQTESRVGEIIRIATKLSNGEFRREHQPHVCVLLVLIETVLPAGVEGHYIAPIPSGGGAFFLDAGNACLPHPVRLRACSPVRNSRVNLGRYVLSAEKRIHFKIGTCFLVGFGGGTESVLHVIVL